MAVYRETPKCPYCNKVIAKAIHAQSNPYNPVYGDSFLRWEYKNHWCFKGLIAKRKMARSIEKAISKLPKDPIFRKLFK